MSAVTTSVQDAGLSGLQPEMRQRSEAALAALVETGDLDRLVQFARLLGSAQDAISDDVVTRLAATAADGLDLLDRANRSGIARALPALAALVETGDLDRLVQLARLIGSAQDAMSDDIVARLAGAIADGLDLLDRVNRSGIARALPALTALVETGDLDRLVQLARLAGSAQDAMNDETVSRLADLASRALLLIDRVTRDGGTLERLFDLLERTEAVAVLGDFVAIFQQIRSAPATPGPARGGLSGLWSIVRQPENQDALRVLLSVARAVGMQGRTGPGAPDKTAQGT